MAITINQANVWMGELTQPSEIISISVKSDNNPRIGCEIAASLAEHEIPVTFATVRPSGKRYEAVYGFGVQEDADRAVELINELEQTRQVRLQVVGGRSPKPKSTGRGIKPKKNTPPRKMRKSA
jgi:hypothetical protein